MKIICARNAPPHFKGLVRDMRPIWALEEIGVPYETEWLDAKAGEQREPAHRALNPYGKFPAMVDGEVTMFESGAICTYIAEKYGALGGPAGSAIWPQTLSWSWAALDTVFPALFEIYVWNTYMKDRPGFADVMEVMTARAKNNLGVVETHLEGRQVLAGDNLTIADILMATSFRYVMGRDVLEGFPRILSYMDRLFARPAFERAYAINASGPAI